MPEPTTSAAAVAAWVSAIGVTALAVLGIQYHALIGALIGVSLMVSAVPAGEATRTRAVALSVAVTTLAAAASGQGLADLIGVADRRPVLILISVAFGALGQFGLLTMLTGVGKGLGERARKLLGGSDV